MKITKRWLKKHKATCTDQLEIFGKEWPQGAEITLENCLRAAELRLDFDWLAGKVFVDGSRLEAYWKGIDSLLKACDKGTTAALRLEAYWQGTAQLFFTIYTEGEK